MAEPSRAPSMDPRPGAGAGAGVAGAPGEKAARLRRLAGRLEELAGRDAGARGRPGVVPTGWPRVDAALAAGGFEAAGGLVRAGVHEWFGVFGARTARGGEDWSPPLSLLIHLAWQAFDAASKEVRGGGNAALARDGHVLWIGRRVWPYPRTLVRDHAARAASLDVDPASEALCIERVELERAALDDFEGEMDGEADGADASSLALLERSVFVDVDEPRERLWTIDMALRCPSVVAVVADGSGFDMASSRRLQLAAEAGAGLGLVARPPWEVTRLSSATTRWRVKRAPSGSGFGLEGGGDAFEEAWALGDLDGITNRERPAWSVELWRSKSRFNRGGDLVGTCGGSSP